MTRRMGNLSLACAIVLMGSTPLMAQTKELHIMNSGGEYGEALDKCVNGPLLEEAGIKVITESPGGYAKIAAQAKSGVITNTTTDGATGDLFRLKAEPRASTSTSRSRRWNASRRTRSGGNRGRSRRSCSRITRCSTPSPGQAACWVRKGFPPRTIRACSTFPGLSPSIYFMIRIAT